MNNQRNRKRTRIENCCQRHKDTKTQNLAIGKFSIIKDRSCTEYESDEY